VYKRYAEKYLLQEQIDEVDISKYVDWTLFRGKDWNSGQMSAG
jgi:hypothetical protein